MSDIVLMVVVAVAAAALTWFAAEDHFGDKVRDAHLNQWRAEVARDIAVERVEELEEILSTYAQPWWETTDDDDGEVVYHDIYVNLN